MSSDIRRGPEPEAPVWVRPEPGVRKTRFSRDDIAAAALRIADAEGVEAVSMRRVAAELGAGTMTLYHYVRTKDELFALVTDAVMAENIVPGTLPSDWREALTEIARRTRGAFTRHPWVYDIVDQPGIGPSGMRHFEQSLEAVASLGLDLHSQLDIISAVDEYVFGFCLRERESTQMKDHGAEMFEELFAYLVDMIESDEFPRLSALVHEEGIAAVWDEIQAHGLDDDRFERNLRRLLDGIEADVAPRGRTRKATPDSRGETPSRAKGTERAKASGRSKPRGGR